MKLTSLRTTSVLRPLAMIAAVALISNGLDLIEVSAQSMPTITGQTTPGSTTRNSINALTPTPANQNVLGGGEFGSVPMDQFSAPVANQINQIYLPPSVVSGTVIGGDAGFPSTDARPLKQAFGQSLGAESSVFSSPIDEAPDFSPADLTGAVSPDMSTMGTEQTYSNGPGCGNDSFFVEEFQGSEFPMEYTESAMPVANVGSDVNTVLGISGLYMNRNYEGNRLLSTGPADLFSRDADHGNMGGVDLNLARRRANGKGWGVRYFQLFPDSAGASVTPFPTTALFGLGAIGVFGGATTQQVYDVGNFHAFTRDTEIHNLEFNLLRNGRQFMTKRNRPGVFEYLFGFRYFQFNEAWNYETETANVVSGYPGFPNPARAAYLNSVENTLLGGQVGGNVEVALMNRLNASLGAKAGLYNNRVNTRQRVDYTSRIDGSVSQPVVLYGPYAGQTFDEGAEKDEVTFLGEIDLGLIYQVSQRARARVGYRAIGVSNVALAGDQIQDDFSSLGLIKDPNVDGDLLLHGGYFGLEFAY
jgi:hypothetical protein